MPSERNFVAKSALNIQDSFGAESSEEKNLISENYQLKRELEKLEFELESYKVDYFTLQERLEQA